MAIASKQTRYIEDASKAGRLSKDDHEALANIARLMRTLSLHSDPEDADALDDPADRAEALRQLNG